MIREALQYVAGLKEQSMEIITREIQGCTYIKGEAKKVYPDYAKELYFNTLSALVDYVRDCLQNEGIKKPYIINVNHDRVTLKSGLDEYKNRESLANTEPLLPRIELNRYLSIEEFIIQLKTCFIETKNLNNLISIVSQITDEAKVEFNDDGFGMKVSQTSGVAIKKETNLEINPIVNLQPFRTFMEVEQPSSRFLIRVKNGGQIALFEADGGAWKLQAQKNISNYLREALKEEIQNKSVVIVG